MGNIKISIGRFNCELERYIDSSRPGSEIKTAVLYKGKAVFIIPELPASQRREYLQKNAAKIAKKCQLVDNGGRYVISFK